MSVGRWRVYVALLLMYVGAAPLTILLVLGVPQMSFGWGLAVMATVALCYGWLCASTIDGVAR